MSTVVESSPFSLPRPSVADRSREGDDFFPLWGFSGPHQQTLLGAFLRERRRLPYQRIWLDSAFADQLAVDCFLSPVPVEAHPGVIIVHGLAGSASSSQVQSLARFVQRELGWPVAGVNLRGTVGPQTVPRLYHGGSSDDLEALIPGLARRWDRPLIVVGFSLGANIVLKWMGEQGPSLHPSVLGACAVACPYELGASAAQLETSWMTRNYRRHLVKPLKQRAQRVLEHFPGLLDPDEVARARSIEQFDRAVTAPLHGFASVKSYYEMSSSRLRLRTIARPTLLLSALDDPFVPSASLPRPEELDPSYVRAEFTRRGGHLGYIGRGFDYWLERRIVTFCKSLISQKEATHVRTSAL